MAASALGLVIGLAPAINQLFYGEHAPFTFIMEAVRYIGQACFPLMTITLGVNLASEARSPSDVTATELGLVSTGRLIIVPLLNTAAIFIAKHANLVPTGDAMLTFVLLLEGCLPSATMLAMCAQSVSELQGRAMAQILLAQYAMSAVSMSCFVAAFLWLVEAWAAPAPSGGPG